jgi:glucokinase
MNNGRVPSSPHAPIIGVDVGGTKVAAATVAGQQTERLTENPTDLRGPEELLAGIEAAVKEAAGGETPAAIGIGVPSQIDHVTGTVQSSVNIPLQGISLRDELSRRLNSQVWVDNDANVAALAEADSAGVKHALMYTLGTGVGGGVIIDGRIFRGATGLGSELGHIVIRADGPNCPGACPNRGCLEALCSGTALGRDGLEIAQDLPGTALAKHLEEHGKVTGREVVEYARKGDPDSIRLMDRFAENLGVGLSNAVNAYEPELIVIGGGLSGAADLFLEKAWEEARTRALPALFARVRVQVARAGAQAGVIGAGLMAAQELERRNMDTAGLTASEGVR